MEFAAESKSQFKAQAQAHSQEQEQVLEKPLVSVSSQEQSTRQDMVLLNNNIGKRYAFVMLDESILLKLPAVPEKFTKQHFENLPAQKVQQLNKLKEEILKFNSDIKSYESMVAFHEISLQNGHYDKLIEENKNNQKQLETKGNYAGNLQINLVVNPIADMEKFLEKFRINLLDRQALIARNLGIEHILEKHSEKLFESLPRNCEIYLFQPEKRNDIAKSLQKGESLSQFIKTNQIKQITIDKSHLVQLLNEKFSSEKLEMLYNSVPELSSEQLKDVDHSKNIDEIWGTNLESNLAYEFAQQDVLKNEKIEKTEKSDKTDKIDKIDKIDINDKMDKSEKTDAVDKIDKTDKSDKNEQNTGNYIKKEFEQEEQSNYSSTPEIATDNSLSLTSSWGQESIEGVHGYELYHFNKTEQNTSYAITNSENLAMQNKVSSLKNDSNKNIEALSPVQRKVFNAIYSAVVKTSDEVDQLMKKRRDIIEHEIGEDKEFREMTLSQRRQLKRLAIDVSKSKGVKVPNTAEYYGMTPKHGRDLDKSDIEIGMSFEPSRSDSEPSLSSMRSKLQMNKVPKK